MEQVLLVMTNLPDVESAQALAHSLVQNKIAACVNLLPGVQSVYRWQGKVEQDQIEFILAIEQRQRRFEIRAVKNLHPGLDLGQQTYQTFAYQRVILDYQ